MLKKAVFFLITAVAFLCSGSDLPGEDWIKAPPEWFNHYETALQEAQKKDKMLFVLQTADWCSFCRRLKKDVLDTKEFREIAEKHFILFYLDIPYKNDKTKMPESQYEYNCKIQKLLKMGIGFPTVKIFQPDGTLVGKHNGYYSYQVFMTWLYETLKLEVPLYPVVQEIPWKNEKTGAIRIVSWGYSMDQVDTPLHAGKINEFACGRRIYFKVEYDPPEPGMEMKLFAWQSIQLKCCDPQKVTLQGTYLFYTDLPLPSAEWWNFNASIYPSKHAKPLRVYLRVQCKISDKNLSEKEKNDRKRKIKNAVQSARFKILSWGLDEKKVDRKFYPNVPIVVKPGQKVYFRIRYKIPMKGLKTHIWMKCPGKERDCGTDTSPLENNQGEITRFIVYRKPVQKEMLLFSFRPYENIGYFADIIKLPCQISWEESEE